MSGIIFGTAYYDEYMPYERLVEDGSMMKKAGINTVRIGESTWSTCEPQDGKFDFSHIKRVLDVMEKNEIQVIIGTPTYAVPTWMVKKHPDILVTTKHGREKYGARQIMDITNPDYLFYCERVIRKLVEYTVGRQCVIGFQLDNETKHYHTAGENVQKEFVEYLKQKYKNNLTHLNKEFGLDYWSNRINAWEDFPDIRGTINGSLGAEFEKFQRTLVDQFLTWQSNIVREYKRENQFITHNFDYEWRGHSYGLQPDVNHYHAAKCLTMAGVDIYHPTQDKLTGLEIAFGGDIARSLKEKNYLVLETQAQGYPGWTPYQGQLRLQAYSHIASGAAGVMYWHSIHNSFETFWRGILSHDLKENEPYREISIIGEEFSKLSKQLAYLKKKNQVAILVSNDALTALNWFGIEAKSGNNGTLFYNDIFRWIYDALYRLNIECDIIWPETEDFEQYKMIFVPALYAASDKLLEKINSYVEQGGNVFVTFKSGFANENIKVSHDVQPHIINKCLGVTYQQFTFLQNVTLSGIILDETKNIDAINYMELVQLRGATELAGYNHPYWKEYAAVTENCYGKGKAYYIGCMTESDILESLIKKILKRAEVKIKDVCFPIIIKEAENEAGEHITFYFNYSNESQKVIVSNGVDILWGESYLKKKEIILQPWSLKIISG